MEASRMRGHSGLHFEADRFSGGQGREVGTRQTPWVKEAV